MATFLNDENFNKEIANTDKLVLVDFFATWCEPCTMLAPILDTVAEQLKGKIVLMKANLDEAPKMAGQFGVEKIPTVMLFKDSKPISGFVGLAPATAIKEWIENISKKHGLGEPDISETIERYDNYAKSNGFRLNPNKTAVERVVKGLFANEAKYGKKYCPCRRVTGNVEEDAKKICPCIWHKEEIEKDGHCLCNLYVK
jgi:thioredoxin 1